MPSGFFMSVLSAELVKNTYFISIYTNFVGFCPCYYYFMYLCTRKSK